MSYINPHMSKLLDAADNRFSVDRSSMSVTDWIMANTTIRGRPFSVKHYEFQRKILDDTHPNLDVQKCSQVGLTEGQIRKILALLCRNKATTGIFTFPDEKTFKKNSATRIKPVIDTDAVFNGERDKHSTRSIPLYQLGKSFLHVVQCTESDATSTPADFVFTDELDISDQQMVSLFNSRVQNSEYRIKQRFSTPTFPSFGINLGFEASDQHHYLARCPACNHWNTPEFNRNFINVPGLPDHISDLTEIDDNVIDVLDIAGCFVKCERCHKALDLNNPELREWVPKYPNRQHHRGYMVSPFVTAKLDPQYIITQLLEFRQKQYIRGFHNTVLGKAYSDGNIRLDEGDINACFTVHSTTPSSIDRSQPTWLGIDMGQTCHLVIGQGNSPETAHIISFEAIHVDKLQARVMDILGTYNVVGGCVDRLPYTPNADALHSVTKGKIIPAQYVNTKELNLSLDAFGETDYAALNRTAVLDTVQRVVKRRLLRMSGYGYHKTVISEHLRDLVRDEKPEQQAVWVKLTGQDHFFHAIGYMLVAMKVKELERLKNGAELRTQTMWTVPKVAEGRANILDIPSKPYKNPLLQSW